ncbi:pre-mRNA-splicing factor CWC22 homolog [Glossina fuscipes]|uniref:Pre-mRNA-splicing factor CWC22 homolog n=1 Tax=Glossina fuscipes TaxID=7396 RepID=A0A8U0WD28_9MUSC|nr:pre-mRNA-splicing factor CWC22 homolog [Glossina fuscipes]KAI9585813.1 hypothetical protein GQX74_001660 [Glossina fuscipes]
MVESDSENANSSGSNESSSSGSSSNSKESVKSVKMKEAEPQHVQKDGKSAAKFKSRWDQRNEFTQSQPAVKKDDCELDKINNEKNSESSKLILMNEKHARGENSANATRTPLNDNESKVNPREGTAKIQHEHEAKTKEVCEDHHNNTKAINVNKLSSSSTSASKEVENSQKVKSTDESVGKLISRSRSRSSDRDDSTARKRDNHSRHSRSPKTKRDRSKSNSFERRSKKQRERERSHSEESKLRRSKRSESLERRREERRKRHAEREDRGRPNKRSVSKEHQIISSASVADKSKDDGADKMTERQRRTVDLLTSRTGGAYIPPAKLRLMQAEITDKSSIAYQRLAWEALKKSIHGYINKVNVDNIAIITRELLKENIVRGRGLLCRSIIQAQAASPTFTHVYAALVAIINSKFPKIGELLLKRLVIQFKRAFRRNDKNVCLSSTRFIAHIVNQRVAHEILALEILTLLVEMPTDDSVEVAIAFLKECGMKLTEVSSKGTGAIFEMLKNILHEGKLDKRVQYMIEVVFQVRKDGFKDHQSVIESLELVEENDQFTHLLTLDEATDPEESLNAFKFDENFETNEDKYKGLSREILGSDASASDGSSSSAGSASESDGASDSDDDGADKPATSGDIIDNTETNLIALRRTIYLTINSSLDYEECAHKLMKMQLKPGQEIELCHMFLDCCAEQRTYEKFYGLLAQRFCAINKIYIEPFEEIFKDTYQTTHRLDTNRLRNVSKFFAHLLFTDAIGWDVLECIKLNEDDTTSSSRIFIKILFQELAEYMGLSQLNRKLKDEALIESLAGVFPKDNPRNTRFSINFFTSIGLGGLTDELRQFLKNAPKSVPAINAEILANKPVKVTTESSSSTSASSSSTTSSSSSSGSSSSSSSSDSSNSSSSESSTDSNSDSILKKVKGKRKGKSNKKQRKNSNIKNKKHKTKKSKKKENKKSKKNRKRQKKRRQESSSSSSESESISDSMSSSSNSSRSSGSNSKSKTRKTTEAKISAKPEERADEKVKHQKDVKRRKQQDENGYDEKVDENRVEQRERELLRRREERERRHRERDQQEECKKVRERSELERSPGDRDRRHNRDRYRDTDRYEERRRQDERDRTRSRSRDHRKRETYAKKQHEYERSRIRTTSKERG